MKKTQSNAGRCDIYAGLEGNIQDSSPATTSAYKLRVLQTCIPTVKASAASQPGDHSFGSLPANREAVIGDSENRK